MITTMTIMIMMTVVTTVVVIFTVMVTMTTTVKDRGKDKGLDKDVGGQARMMCLRLLLLMPRVSKACRPLRYSHEYPTY